MTLLTARPLEAAPHQRFAPPLRSLASLASLLAHVPARLPTRARGLLRGASPLALCALLAGLYGQGVSTDLHDAVTSGDLERVKREIAAGAGVNQPDQMGATPLHDAAWNGNREIALYLLEHGANPKARHTEGGSQPLAYACIKNDILMVELLLVHGADLRAADNAGATALHLAVDRGYFQLAAVLMDRGADVNVRDKAGSSPLDEAARRGFREIALSLILHGAKVDQPDPTTGSTPLNEAARKGHRELVALLLEKGADPKHRDQSGASPIENAARGRHAEALELLIVAAGPATAEISALLSESAIKGQTEIADLLLAKGAHVDARDKSGATPLHQAALKGNLAFATLLLQHGADVNARDADGATPLHNAAVAGQRDMAALLLDKGADREARDTESGGTPLYHAAAWGRTSVVQLLLTRGAVINSANKAGVTPLATAEKNGFAETAALLKLHGAR
ncbi:MAG: ankyrin repeat domain-containing protein [Candidatus Solibacter sp.]